MIFKRENKKTDPLFYVVALKDIIYEPLLEAHHGFNARGQIDLINFSSCADGDYKYILNVHDHATKFVHLRPLKNKEAKSVASELLKIFLAFRAPKILQSDNGRKFVAEVLEQLKKLWPG